MNIADKVTMLVSMYMFLTMPEQMKPSKIIFNIQVTSKSNMAAIMAANMTPEHIRFIHKNSNNDI
jgi:hypothetical protein